LLNHAVGLTIDLNGDILVTAVPESQRTGVVVRVNVATGSQTLISLGGHLVSPFGIAVDVDGHIFVTSLGAVGIRPGEIIQVDPRTGSQSVVSSGDYLSQPTGIAISPYHNLLVTDNIGHSVIRINPATGAQALVASDFIAPYGITLIPIL
jgi:DNA-binding beta-propeller fold protein YncE